MSQVKVLVLSGYGLNCDHETAYSFQKMGAAAYQVHINDLTTGRCQLNDFDILVFTGGFSWGDDHGAGVLQALRIKKYLQADLQRFIERNRLIIGICNGFQTLVNLGLLPGVSAKWERQVALIHNDCGNFRNDWVKLSINSSSPCVFTKNLDYMELPIRHGEGKFYAGQSMIQDLLDKQLIVMQYATDRHRLANQRFPDNPNGSAMDIGGICDPTGHIFGLMPHPEAFHHETNHPQWSRLSQKTGINLPLGTQLFSNAIHYIQTL
ncbi:MAG: Phosphoribosylformylglycinamidine synthase I [Candidatus Magnetoglobus multicellularis str. Araruama]|uniref:Phosphoribosylformylglycinamidine synthase I n=1 Tax=Candidatus Magnetoglobus multicellularis str. Araruama TaxID=890399 RepID=A0A1V1PFJ9_9BACT|nr:MAG: Phosphoribosylformylglycinamidine synthase I [Candidatus Magnetoglobus multicellularis str. Araruama]